VSARAGHSPTVGAGTRVASALTRGRPALAQLCAGSL